MQHCISIPSYTFTAESPICFSMPARYSSKFPYAPSNVEPAKLFIHLRRVHGASRPLEEAQLLPERVRDLV